jgi:hypothetical protein
MTITCCVALINKKYHAGAGRWNFPVAGILFNRYASGQS